MMLLEILVFALLFFSIGGFVYEASGLFNRFYHDVLNWHRPRNDAPIMIKGGEVIARCEYCGKRITQDRYGGWY